MRAFVAVILVAIVLLAMGHFAEAIGVTAFLAWFWMQQRGA